MFIRILCRSFVFWDCTVWWEFANFDIKPICMDKGVKVHCSLNLFFCFNIKYFFFYPAKGVGNHERVCTCGKMVRTCGKKVQISRKWACTYENWAAYVHRDKSWSIEWDRRLPTYWATSSSLVWSTCMQPQFTNF